MAAWLAPVIGAASSLIGAGLSSGSKPNLPQPITVDPFSTQRSWLRNQQQMLPTISNLTTDINYQNQAQRQAMLRGVLPEMDALQGQATTNMGRYLSGAFTPEEEALIRRESAGRAFNLGVGGSPLSKSWELGSLLGNLSQRQQSATAAYPSFMTGITAPRMTQQADVTGWMPTYGDVLSALTGNAQNQNQRNMYQSQIDAAPNPALAALGNSMSTLGGMAFRYGLTGNKQSQNASVNYSLPGEL